MARRHGEQRGTQNLGQERRIYRVRNLPKIETVEPAKEVLLGMDEEREMTAELDGWQASIKKHNDQEYTVESADLTTRAIRLLHASYILLEHGEHDLSLG